MSLFWEGSAGPSFYDYINMFDSGGRFMRLIRAHKPAPYTNESLILNEPEFLTKSNASEIATFWNTHYCDVDWRMDASEEWVSSLFDSSKVVLGVRDERNRLIGTIMSRKIGGNLVGVQVGMTLTSDRIFVIEGLCIHRDFRGKHLAGWLISYMDYITSEHGPVAHIFSRELESIPYFSNAIEVETYGYIETSKVKESQTKKVVLLDDYVFQTKFMDLLFQLNLKYLDKIALSTGIIDSGDMMCFVCWGMVNGTVVIADSHRKTNKDLKIYEVIFCMGKETELLLNSVAFELEKSGKGGILFGTDNPYHGALNASFSDPWKFGTSGYHATYFYNYLPAIRKLNFLLVRNSI
jgi:hypothetical protein